MIGGSSMRAAQIVNSKKKICNNTKNFFTVPDIFFDSISANTDVKNVLQRCLNIYVKQILFQNFPNFLLA